MDDVRRGGLPKGDCRTLLRLRKMQQMVRLPSSARNKKFESLEALRATAALLVVMYHLQDIFTTRFGLAPFGGVFGAGDRGVDLFFVLSGFIIVTTHAKDVGTSGRCVPYIYKRVSRIFPGVWILTTFAAITYACQFGGTVKAAKLDPWNIAASFALLPQNGPPLVNVTWTLTYEIFFYALFALIVVRPKSGLFLLLIWQVSIALGSIGLLQWNSWVAAYYFRPICLEFGIGILCAVLVGNPIVRQRFGWRSQSILFAAGVGLFGGGALYEGLVLSHGLEPQRVMVFGLSAGCMIFALALRESQVTIRVPSALLWLGEASYAIYLVHYSVITFAAVVLLRLSYVPITNLVLFGCVGLGIGAGSAFHLWVDRPIQGTLRRLGRRLFDTTSRQPVYNAVPAAVLRTGNVGMLARHEPSANDRLVP